MIQLSTHVHLHRHTLFRLLFDVMAVDHSQSIENLMKVMVKFLSLDNPVIILSSYFIFSLSRAISTRRPR